MRLAGLLLLPMPSSASAGAWTVHRGWGGTCSGGAEAAEFLIYVSEMTVP